MNDHQIGYKRGKSEGFADGFDKGYDKGYRKGIKDKIIQVEEIFNLRVNTYSGIIDWLINNKILTKEQKKLLDKAFDNGDVRVFLETNKIDLSI